MDATTREPRFLEMTPDQLRASYASFRRMEYNVAGIASAGCSNRRRVAASWGRCHRAIEMIEAIARKRGINLFDAGRDPHKRPVR